VPRATDPGLAPPLFTCRLSYTDGDDSGDFTTAVSDWKIGDAFLTGDG
jgi:hypothetical protein